MADVITYRILRHLYIIAKFVNMAFSNEYNFFIKKFPNFAGDFCFLYRQKGRPILSYFSSESNQSKKWSLEVNHDPCDPWPMGHTFQFKLKPVAHREIKLK